MLESSLSESLLCWAEICLPVIVEKNLTLWDSFIIHPILLPCGALFHILVPWVFCLGGLWFLSYNIGYPLRPPPPPVIPLVSPILFILTAIGLLEDLVSVSWNFAVAKFCSQVRVRYGAVTENLKERTLLHRLTFISCSYCLPIVSPLLGTLLVSSSLQLGIMRMGQPCQRLAGLLMEPEERWQNT